MSVDGKLREVSGRTLVRGLGLANQNHNHNPNPNPDPNLNPNPDQVNGRTLAAAAMCGLRPDRVAVMIRTQCEPQCIKVHLEAI